MASTKVISSLKFTGLNRIRIGRPELLLPKVVVAVALLCHNGHTMPLNIFSAFSYLFSTLRRLMDRLAISNTSDGKKTLILDLDRTLIYCASYEEYSKLRVDKKESPLTWNNRFILKRPGVDAFLMKASKKFHLVVYSASSYSYCNAVVDWLDGGRHILQERYCVRSCVWTNGKLTKNVAMVCPDLSKVAILDDKKSAVYLFEENAIRIKPWFGEADDTELKRVRKIIKRMENCEDVRIVLSMQDQI